MYLEPLTKTSVDVLAFLSSRVRESFTVRQIAEAIGKDYKITHTMTTRLAKQGYVIAEKKPPVTYCRLNLKGNSQLLAYIEGIRVSRFFQRHRDTEIILNDLVSRISPPFFILILFGSHAKSKASPRSDLDVLLVVPERNFENEVETAIETVQRVSPLGIHETILTHGEFIELLKEKKPNVAWEAVDNRIVPYGSETLFRTLEKIL
jgi:predicted nucleotidyltransferase